MKREIISFINAGLGNIYPDLVSHRGSPVNQSLMECIVYSLRDKRDDIQNEKNEVSKTSHS